VLVTFYTDSNANDVSTYAGGFEPGSDDPTEGVTAELLGLDAGSGTATSCSDGQLGFADLEDGVYLVVPSFPEGVCSQKNCPARLPIAIREGEVKIVTFGDSVPVVGDAPFFPERLADLMAPLATIDNQNVAVGGTVSDNWLPGTPHFENRLAPHIDDADVILISLGGNDLLAFLQTKVNNIQEILNNLEAVLEEVRQEIERVVENIFTTVAAIRERNPNVDIVYLLYADYSLATSNQLWSAVNGFVGAEVVHDVLETARDGIPPDENVVLVDVFGATEGLPLDDYLFDALHFNDRGQTLYAEEIFQTLGGVLVGPSPLGGDPRTPLGAERSYGVR
jgi:lysophospholipase L1-like esterase